MDRISEKVRVTDNLKARDASASKKSESRDESERVPGDLTTLTLTTFGVWFIVHKFWEVSA